MEDNKAKIYLDYLEKEMNIMGILSTFCVAVLALVLDRIIGNKDSELVKVLNSGFYYVGIGSICLLMGALFFYRQRSLLAWYYGQICLCATNFKINSWTLEEWLKDADSWSAWLHYRIAFGFVIVAFIEYGLGLLSIRDARLYQCQASCALLPVCLAILFLTPWLLILKKYKYEDKPIKSFFKGVTVL